MRIKSFFSFCFRWGLTALVLLCILGALFLFALELSLPNVTELKDVHLQEPLRVLTADGKLIAEFGHGRRVPITYKQIPKYLIDATVDTEDKRFFSHPGVDWRGLARAAVILVATGQKRQGGSTITMQVARNYFLTRKKSYIRKLREILLALKISHTFSKQKVLELYFNKIFYGYHAYGIAAAAQIYYGKTLDQLTLPQMAMLAGLPKAPSMLNPLANPKFAKDRRDHVLYRMYKMGNIDQATYQKAINTPLTAMYHGLRVSVYAPYVAEMARILMLEQFGKKAYENGYTVYTTIKSKLQKTANQALEKGLLAYDHRHGFRGALENLGTPPDDLTPWIKRLNNYRELNGIQAAAVLMVSDDYVSVLLKTGEQVIVTWSHMKWARKQILKPNNEFLGPRPKQPSDILNVGDVIYVMKNKRGYWQLEQVPQAEAALVALNPKDGAILALVGGFNFQRSKYNRITQSYRQPGSAFKPFLYSAALAKGETLATVVNDAPIAIPQAATGQLWRPENDTHQFYGPTRLREALIHSRNVATIKMLQLIGVPYALDYATRFGFKRDQLPDTLSIALGTTSLTPLQLATGYMIFANGGYAVKPYYISRILDNNLQPVFTADPLMAGPVDAQTMPQKDSKVRWAPRVITPQNAYLMTSAMKSVIKQGTGRPARVLRRSDLAGKTGTTNDQKDGWFCGFNSKVVTVSWMGFDQPRSLYEYAIRAALPVWIDFMRRALKGQPLATMSEPNGIVTVRINKKTGLLARPGDKNAMFEIFRRQYAPKRSSRLVSTDHQAEADFNQLY